MKASYSKAIKTPTGQRVLVQVDGETAGCLVKGHEGWRSDDELDRLLGAGCIFGAPCLADAKAVVGDLLKVAS
ncbi:MAG: hypothetical protein OXE50_06735 [Chloroflexi bacterium]|nr:hypothetical protein [Chloroflexota bacterium]